MKHILLYIYIFSGRPGNRYNKSYNQYSPKRDRTAAPRYQEVGPRKTDIKPATLGQIVSGG